MWNPMIGVYESAKQKNKGKHPNYQGLASIYNFNSGIIPQRQPAPQQGGR